MVDNIFGRVKGVYPIKEGLSVGAVAFSSDDQYMLVSAHDERRKYDFLYLINTETNKQIDIVKLGPMFGGTAQYLDRMVALNDGYILRLEREFNRIRKYGFIRGKIPWCK